MEVFISLFMKYLGYKPMEKLTLLDARTFILDKRRIAISNQRILGMTDQTVTYLVKDYRNSRRYIPHTIKGIDFLRMFLMHVLPKGFVRIRHYGLLSCRNKKEKMKLCRKLLNFISSVWENLNSYPIPFSIHTTSNFPLLWIVHTIDFRYMIKNK